MKIYKEIEVKVSEDGLVVFREPSNKEWNDFTAKRYPFGKRGRVTDNSVEARAELFDKLLIRIENIEDEQGLITLETAKERIPIRFKSEMIFNAFEIAEVIETKNS